MWMCICFMCHTASQKRGSFRDDETFEKIRKSPFLRPCPCGERQTRCTPLKKIQKVSLKHWNALLIFLNKSNLSGFHCKRQGHSGTDKPASGKWYPDRKIWNGYQICSGDNRARVLDRRKVSVSKGGYGNCKELGEAPGGNHGRASLTTQYSYPGI